MSSQAVEARSLSTLTALASNPPAYPRNPTHVKHDQLVLYIARVPGSRDVFLTPMKPREKVVTAEDIQSSLYFVHVEQPDDDRLIVPPPEPDYAERHSLSTDRPSVPTVHRKPMPSSLVSGPVPAGMPLAPKRKPVPGTLAPVNDFDNRQNVSASNHLQRANAMLGPDYVPRRSEDSIRYQGENGRPPLPPRRPSEPVRSEEISLTLIRRDPASSAQWNVASIKDSPVEQVSSFGVSDPKKRTGAPVYIEITNPGYSKFLNNSQGEVMQPLASRRTDLSTRSYNPGNSFQSNAFGEPANPQTQEEEFVFRRRLWLEGSKYGNAPFGHRKINSNDSSISRSSMDGWQRERSSIDSRAPPPFLSRDDQPYSTIQVSEKQSSFRGYVFVSPWNGRCEFVTGTGGGSLKCRHVVPGLQGAPPMAMPVSELRFNLPSSSKVSTPRGEESTKRSSFFHRPRHSRHNSSVSDNRGGGAEDVRNSFDRLDLSLGQEFAGGGFGGKQAKLGKLIIEDEGLKMIDLLVAANVALWWRAYEKADAKSRSERSGF